MSAAQWDKHVRILAYDLRGYSSLPDHAQKAVAEKLRVCAEGCTPEGATQAGVKLPGDGGLIFFDGPVGSNFDAVGLFRDRMTEQEIPLPDIRFALHDGEVHFSGHDYQGQAVNHVSRLLDGMPRQPAGMTVLSGELANRLKNARDGLDNRIIRLRDIDSKEGPIEAWAATLESFLHKEGGAEVQFADSFGPRPWFFQRIEGGFNKVEIEVFLARLPTYVAAGFAAREALRLFYGLTSRNFESPMKLDVIVAAAPSCFISILVCECMANAGRIHRP